jgi:SAM-dependent methyltransferase
MRHPEKVSQAIYFATLRRLRLLLRVPPRPRPPPVLGQNLAHVLARHRGIVRVLRDNLPASLDLKGQIVCEVGPGDCLAVAGFYLGLGAARVDLVEISPPVVNEKQHQVLDQLRQEGLPIDPTIVQPGPGGWQLDTARVVHHPKFMENLEVKERYALISSFSVVEHVEDLAGFHASCRRALRTGGWALHIVDLGGHEQFEDPLPPLDFQTYPDWLYWLMYPRHFRATRHFLDEHLAAASNAGFKLESARCLRRVERDQLNSIWPELRAAARSRRPEEVGVIEFAMLLQKVNS